ncbi:hypothetical protein FPHYL_5410 [Fusarium phyllophilum]|uniref:Uncharacterized protein n=1 Tax=Fusarium phyllophilum TaxID=47803 RepID=A0A8H5JZN4_9HYPO|nr:hypothetical protein FPHYL_5410 [Fusarium phyllophilum]
MDHIISGLSQENKGNESTTGGLPPSPQLYAVMDGSVQHIKTEMKMEHLVSGLQTNQDTINLMKRPAEGSCAPQKKSRKTKSHNDVEESERDRDYYSGSDGIAKEMTGIIRDIWRQDGSQIVSKSVQERGLPATPGQLLSLLPELLDKVEDRFENKPLKEESDVKVPKFEGPLTEINTGARDDSYQGFRTLDHCPDRAFYASDFDSVSTSDLLPSNFLKSMSVARYQCDPVPVEEAFEPEGIDSEWATTSFTAHTEPLICMTAFDPADHPYHVFQQGPLSQTAGTEIYQDWPGLSDDYSLDFLEG